MYCLGHLILMSLFILGYSAEDNLQTAIVETPSGPVKGIKATFPETGDTIYEFRGIRYGQPPVGPLRFKKPIPVDKWRETYDATEFGAACPQMSFDFLPGFEKPYMSEDCLVLNVYVPKILEPSQKLSVMVWIHGGGLVFGHAHQYNGGRISVTGNVITVTINYRLGVFGFLALDHPAARGNYALWDQKLALQWVHENIAAFGGDPDSVTLFGESAGGWSVHVQSMIPSNKGLFQKAISQSGVFDFGRTSMLKQKKLLEYAKDLGNKTACPLDDMFDFVDCLRTKTFDELITATNLFTSMPNDQYTIQSRDTPVIDGELFTDNPLRSLVDSQSDVSQFFRSIDFIGGTTSNEGSLIYMTAPGVQEYFGFNATESIPLKFICEGLISPYVKAFLGNENEAKSKLCKFYMTDGSIDDQSLRGSECLADILIVQPTIRMLEYHSSMGGNTYQYRFSKTSPVPVGGPPPSWFKGCGHADELVFLFPGKVLGTEDAILNADEEGLSKHMIKYWTSFAKSGYVV